VLREYLNVILMVVFNYCGLYNQREAKIPIMTKVIRVFSSENKDVGTISTIKGESLIFLLR
jgi:hypothetical protein